MNQGFRERRVAALLCVIAGLGGAAQAGEVLQIKPGLWKSESEVWVAGQSLKAAMPAAEAPSHCVTPAESKVDIDNVLQRSLGDGVWSCRVNDTKRGAGTLSGRFDCRTTGGGHSHGDLQATYSDTGYRFELKGRTNAVDGRSGQALGNGQEFDVRLQSQGNWLGACKG